MAIRIEDIEVLADRWAARTEQAARKFLIRGGTHQQLAWAISCESSSVRTLTRRAGREVSLTVPGWLRKRLGWNPGDRVALCVTARGTLEVRLATLTDLPEIARPAAECVDRLLAQRLGRRELKHFEKRCERCCKLYCAQRSNCRFCPHCGVLRARESKRACWRRTGKQSPSYQARLAKRTLAPTGASS